MSLRRSGINPLSYMGVEPVRLSSDVVYPRAPTENDINFNLSTRWLDSTTQGYWVLVNLADGVATWVLLSESGHSGISSVTTDDSLVVTADDDGNINVFGAHGINTTGSADPFPHTVTVRVNNTLTLGDEADVGASPSLLLESGILQIVNGNAVVGNTENNALSSEVIFEKSRTGGVITTGDDLGGVVFQGYDGTSYVSGASITAVSSGTIGTNQVAGNLQFSTHPDSASALTARMTINSAGDVTINAPDSGTALTVNGDEVITGNLTLPDTTAANATGTIIFGADRFITDYGTNNTFVGKLSGNGTLTPGTAINNTAIGARSGTALTTGTLNSAVGSFALNAATTGQDNTAIGYAALTNITTGRDNTALGFAAGSAHTLADSSNIDIGNVGMLGESNVIRIGGGTGTGDGEQDTCYISGINGNTIASPMYVTIDPATDQLGVAPGSGVINSLNVQIFLISGTYTPTAGMSYCIIEVVGGGGGGGSCSATTISEVSCGAGGGAGGYARGLFTAATIGASQAVTIGAGGAGGAAGNNFGVTGGTTSVGVLISADGGIGGQGGSATINSLPQGGEGGLGAGGNFHTRGGPGGNGLGQVITSGGVQQFAIGGSGGISFFGGGAPANTEVNASDTGFPATSFGGGGGGAAGTNDIARAGGDGYDGFVVITEFA